MRVTESQIKRLIHQSNLIEGYDDPKMDDQGLIAWRRLLPIPFNGLTHYDILKTQKIITITQTDLFSSQRGYYRGEAGNNTNVRIAGRLAPSYVMVKSLMQNWLLDYQKLNPIEAHIRFEKVHPFADGNGRTGRLLLWWMQLKRAEPLARLSAKNRHEYYEWFR